MITLRAEPPKLRPTRDCTVDTEIQTVASAAVLPSASARVRHHPKPDPAAASQGSSVHSAFCTGSLGSCVSGGKRCSTLGSSKEKDAERVPGAAPAVIETSLVAPCPCPIIAATLVSDVHKLAVAAVTDRREPALKPKAPKEAPRTVSISPGVARPLACLAESYGRRLLA